MTVNFCASQILSQMCKHSFTYLSMYRRRDGAAILLTCLKSKPGVTNVMAKCSQRRLLKSSASGKHSALLMSQFEQSPSDSDCWGRMRAGADSSWASPPPHGDASSKWEEEMSNFSIGGKNDNRTVQRGGDRREWRPCDSLSYAETDFICLWRMCAWKIGDCFAHIFSCSMWDWNKQ